MSALAWAAVITAAAAVGFLGLALAGLVRTVDRLRAQVAALEDDRIVHLPTGPAIGFPAPRFRGRSPDGLVVDAADLRGRRYLVALTDPDCAGCRDLLPELLSPAASALPPRIVVVAGDVRSTGDAPDRSGEATVLLDPEGRISEAFGAPFTPYVVVVDEDGFVVASGAAADLAGVRRLVGDAEGIRIVPDATPERVTDG